MFQITKLNYLLIDPEALDNTLERERPPGLSNPAAEILLAEEDANYVNPPNWL